MNLRRLSEQNYYQVLEVPYDATSDDIQSAYEEAREMYGHDALVAGSILSEQERRNAFHRIAQAYQTLIAEESRRLYDETLGVGEPRSFARRDASRIDTEREKTTPHEAKSEARASSDDRAVTADEAGQFGAPTESIAEPGADSESERELEPEPEPEPAMALTDSEPSPPAEARPRHSPVQLGLTEEATGEFLRSAREALGLDLGTISEETKIGRSMLEYIENERLDRLPAPVYLRNFTLQVARCLGLDEEKVSRTYLARIRRLQSV